MTERRYTVLLTSEPDGSAYNVTVPALPGCFTYGETIEEAIEMAKDAIAGFVAALADRGEPVPEDKGDLVGLVLSEDNRGGSPIEGMGQPQTIVVSVAD